MKVSVIVPIYFGKKYLNSLVENLSEVAEKTYKEYACKMEIIFVNDSPEEKITHASTKVDYIILNNDRNRGIHYSRVRGLAQAQGDYVVFLDQDDKLAPSYLISQLKCIGDYDVVICNGIFRNDRAIMQDDDAYRKVEDKIYYIEHLESIASPGQALIKRTTIPVAWTQYIMKNNYCDDALLWVLMKNDNKKFKVNKEILYYHCETDSNTSFNWGNNAKALREMKNIILENNLLTKDNVAYFIRGADNKIKKQKEYRALEDDMKIIEQNNTILKNYFKKEKVEYVDLYGYGVFGKRLEKVLDKIGISVCNIIDQNVVLNSKRTIMKRETYKEHAQMNFLIITPIMSVDEIMNNLSGFNNYKISLKELLNLAIREGN